VDAHARPDGIDLRRYAQLLVRRRWVVILAVLACVLGALVVSFLTTPLYRASTVLQIERRQPDILGLPEVHTPELWSAFDHFYQTQYAIIRSEPVARLAATRLELASHPAFGAGSARPGLVARLARLLPRKGRPAIQRDPLDVAAARLQARLEVLPLQYSYLVQVAWHDPDPEFAAAVANAIADAYIRFNLQSRFSTNGQAEEFLVDQIQALEEEIAALEETLQGYAREKRIVSIDASDNLTLQALGEISEKRTAAEAELVAAEAAYRETLASETDELVAVRDSPLIAQLRTVHAQLEAEISRASSTFRDDWPELQTLRSQLEQTRARLELETERIARQVRGEAEATYRRALRESRELDRLRGRHEDDVQRQRQDAVRYANLQSGVQKKRETLDALLQRQNEMALSTRLQDLDLTTSNVIVIESAKPPGAPFRPRTGLNLVIGLLLGLSLGPALAFLLDYLDNTIASAEELREATGLAVLAVISRHGQASGGLARVRRRGGPPAASIDLVAHREARAAASEAYRGLRTSLLLSRAGEPPRRIVVTSALPQEGKSATTVNLAIVLAQLGRRVLVVDADLRRPRLHAALGTDNARGLSTYLCGMAEDPCRLVVPTAVPRLEFLPSGPVPPNPSELLDSERFGGLGTLFGAAGYDHVLLDAPPVLSVTDPLIVAASSDLTLLVVRAERTPRQSVQAAAERLRQLASVKLGAVLNDLDPQAHGNVYDAYAYAAERVEEPATSRLRGVRRAGDRRG
jgi:capsular exopolysaccharide synthesis family protein